MYIGIITNARMNIKGIVNQNRTNFAILLFLVGFSMIHYYKPIGLSTEEGAFREFGVGYTHKTVVPIWLVAIFLAIVCYMAVLYYLAYM